jgi:hypothetical protein
VSPLKDTVPPSGDDSIYYYLDAHSVLHQPTHSGPYVYHSPNVRVNLATLAMEIRDATFNEWVPVGGPHLLRRVER